MNPIKLKSSDELFESGTGDLPESSEATIGDETLQSVEDEVEEHEDSTNESMDSSPSPHNTTSPKKEKSPLSSSSSNESLEDLDSSGHSPSSSSLLMKTSDHSPQSEKTKLSRSIRKPTRFQDGAVTFSPTDVVDFFEVEDLEEEKATIKLVKVKSPEQSIASTSEKVKPTTALIHSDETRDKCVSFDENGNFRFKVCKEHTLRKNGGLTSYRCDICDMLFPRSFSLRRHYERIHINPRFVRNKGKKDQEILTKLLDADKAAASSSVKHRKEQKENETFFLYACKMCSKQQSFFKTKKELRHHHQSKHCALIQKQFAAFKCESCDRSYATRHELRRHKRSHSGERPYACQYCHKRFPTSTNARRHERTHTGDRPHVCKVCNKRFIQKTDMVKHLRSVHKMKVTKTKAQIAGKKDDAEETADNKSNQFEENIDFAAYLNLDQYEKGTLMGGSNEAGLTTKGNLQLPAPTPESPKQTQSSETRAKIFQPSLDVPVKSVVTMSQDESLIRSHGCPECSKLFTSRVNMRRHYRLKHERNQVVRSALPVSMVVSKFKIQEENQSTNKMEDENHAQDLAEGENREKEEAKSSSAPTLQVPTSIVSSPAVSSSILLKKSSIPPTTLPTHSSSSFIQPLTDLPMEVKKESPSTYTNKQGSKLGKILERLSNRKTASSGAETAKAVATKPSSLSFSEEAKIQRRSENIISSDTLLQSMQPHKKKNLVIRNNPLNVAKYIKQRYSHPANSSEEKQHKVRHSLMLSKKIKKPAEPEADLKQQEKKPGQFFKMGVERSDRKFHPYEKQGFQSKYRATSENARFFPNAARVPPNQSRFHQNPSRFHVNILRQQRKQPRLPMYPHPFEQRKKEFYRSQTSRGVIRPNTKQEKILFPQRSRHSYPLTCKHEHPKIKSFLDDCWRSKMNEHSECNKCLQKPEMQNPMWNVSTTPRSRPLSSHPPNELWRTSKHIVRDRSMNNTCVSSTQASSSSAIDSPLDLRHPSKKPASGYVVTKSGVLDLSKRSGHDLSDQKKHKIEMTPEASFPQNLSCKPHGHNEMLHFYEPDYDANKSVSLERQSSVTSAHPTLKFHNVMFDKGRQVHGAGTAGRPIKPPSIAPLYKEPPQTMKDGMSRDGRRSFDHSFPPDHVVNRFSAHKFAPIHSRYVDVKPERRIFDVPTSNILSAEHPLNPKSKYASPFVPHSHIASQETNEYRFSSPRRHRTFSHEDPAMMRSRLTHHHDHRDSENFSRRASGDVDDDVMTMCIQKAQNQLMRSGGADVSPRQNMESLRRETFSQKSTPPSQPTEAYRHSKEFSRRPSGDVNDDVMTRCIQKAQNELMRSGGADVSPLQNMESLRRETFSQKSTPQSQPTDGVKSVLDPSSSRISLTMTPGFDTNGEDSSREEDTRSPVAMLIEEETCQENIEEEAEAYFVDSTAVQEPSCSTVRGNNKHGIPDKQPLQLTVSGRSNQGSNEDEQHTLSFLNCDIEDVPARPTDLVTSSEIVKETDLSIADLKETNLSRPSRSSQPHHGVLVTMEPIPSQSKDSNQSTDAQQNSSESEQFANVTTYEGSHSNESKSKRKYIQKIKLRAVKTQENNGTRKWTLVDTLVSCNPGTSSRQSSDPSSPDVEESSHDPDDEFSHDREISQPEQAFHSHESIISSHSDASALSSELISSSQDSCDISDNAETSKTENVDFEVSEVSTNQNSIIVPEDLESKSAFVELATVEPEKPLSTELAEDESIQLSQSFEDVNMKTPSGVNEPIVFTPMESPAEIVLTPVKQETTPRDICEERSLTNEHSMNDIISEQSVSMSPHIHDETKHESDAVSKHELSRDIVLGSCVEILELQQPGKHSEVAMVTSPIRESILSEAEVEPVTTVPSLLDHGYAVTPPDECNEAEIDINNGGSSISEVNSDKEDFVSANTVLVPATAPNDDSSTTVSASEVTCSQGSDASPLASNTTENTSTSTALVLFVSSNITSSSNSSSNVSLVSHMNLGNVQNSVEMTPECSEVATTPIRTTSSKAVIATPVTSSVVGSSNCTSSTVTSSSVLRLDVNEESVSLCDTETIPVTSSSDAVSCSLTHLATSTTEMSLLDDVESAAACSPDTEPQDNAVPHYNETIDDASSINESLDADPQKLMTLSNDTSPPSTAISLRVRKTSVTPSAGTKSKSVTRKVKAKPGRPSAKIQLSSSGSLQTIKGPNDVSIEKRMRTRSSMGDDTTKRSKKRSCVKQEVKSSKKKLKKNIKPKTPLVANTKAVEIDTSVVKNATRGMRPSKQLPQVQTRPKRGENPPKSKPPPLTRRSIRKYSKKVSTANK